MNVTWSNSSRKVRFLGLPWSYLGKIFLSLTNKIQSFQRLKNFRRFRVFVLSYRISSKKPKQRKSSKPSFQWQINEWSSIFMGLTWSFRKKTPKKLCLGNEFFSRKQWTSLGAILSKSSFVWVYIEFMFLKSLLWHI